MKHLGIGNLFNVLDTHGMHVTKEQSINCNHMIHLIYQTSDSEPPLHLVYQEIIKY